MGQKEFHAEMDRDIVSYRFSGSTSNRDATAIFIHYRVSKIRWKEDGLGMHS